MSQQSMAETTTEALQEVQRPQPGSRAGAHDPAMHGLPMHGSPVHDSPQRLQWPPFSLSPPPPLFCFSGGFRGGRVPATFLYRTIPPPSFLGVLIWEGAVRLAYLYTHTL